MSLERFKQSVVSLIIVALLIAALALALDGFQTGIEGDNPCSNSTNVWNGTDSLCYADDTGLSVAGGTNYQYNATLEGLEGTQNASSYLSTIGTFIGIAALIAIVVSAFYIARR